MLSRSEDIKKKEKIGHTHGHVLKPPLWTSGHRTQLQLADMDGTLYMISITPPIHVRLMIKKTIQITITTEV